MNYGETFLLQSFNSNTSHSFDTIVDEAYNKKVEMDNKRMRDRSNLTVPGRKVNPLHSIITKIGLKTDGDTHDQYKDEVKESDD